jgi:hypothetical protein
MSKNHLASSIMFCFIYLKMSCNETDGLNFSDDDETCLLIVSDVEDQHDDPGI